jgi:hypothetical protein
MRTSGLWALGAAALVVLTAGNAGAALITSYGMNETSGSLVDNTSGVNMTPQNAAAFTYGAATVPAGTYGAITLTPAQASAFGTAITGNGTSVFSNTTSGNALNNLAAPLTVMAWINPANTAALQRVMSGSSGDGNGWGYGVLAGGGQRFTTYGKTDFNQGVGATAQAGAWQHIAATFDGSTANFYLNGNLVDTKTGNNFGANASEVYALFGQANATEPFSGTIDEVRVYGTALSQGEIVTAASTAAPEPATLGLLGLAAGTMLARRRRSH